MRHLGTYIRRPGGWAHVWSLAGARWGLGVAIDSRDLPATLEIELLVVAFVIPLP